MKTIKVAVSSLVIGMTLAVVSYQYLLPSAHASTASVTPKPLYWVAPMDPKYKRDKPGKSPMGMDLVPVYGESDTSQDPAGTVKIDPTVENNLGVTTAMVKFAPLTPSINTVGYINFDQSHIWQINTRVSGWIEKSNVSAIGDKVNKGQLLFSLYSPELVKAQEELLQAKRSGNQYLTKAATERLLALGVDALQIKQILSAGKASRNIAIKALDDGVITSLNIREGGYLTPAQIAIKVASLNQVWVTAEVFDHQAYWLDKNSRATMTLDAIPDRQWQGKINYIEPVLDPITRTLQVRITFPNPNNQLKPNMFANIHLQSMAQQAVLSVPFEAVIRSGNMTRVVLAEGNGKYRSVRIKVGREADNRVEVLQGLTKQDRVVTSAQFLLDSESSQTADLARISSPAPKMDMVWGQGIVTKIMPNHHMITIKHQAIAKWNWPAMTMNFNLANNLSLQKITTGENIDFEIMKMPDGQYQVVNYKSKAPQTANQVWLSGEIKMLMPASNMISIEHKAMNKWQLAAGEMHFTNTHDVDLNQFETGQKIQFLVEKNGANYSLKQLKPMGVKP